MKRSFLQSSARAGIAAVSAVLSLGMVSAKAEPAKKPNVLFIAVDDLNDWIGALGGHPGVKTPNLDRLAQQGEVFTRTYCASPACGPSRSAIMSGILPSRSGLYRNDDVLRENAMLKDAVMLPQYMAANGYYSLGAGKIYHDPDPQSWQEYWPSLDSQRKGDPRIPVAPAGSSSSFMWGPLDVDSSEMGDWQVADWVIEKLKNPPKEPMFLACGIFRPHLPWGVPKKYYDMYPLESITLPPYLENDLDDLPAAGRKFAFEEEHARITQAGAWKAAVQAYLASITFADECIGRVLDALEKSPIAKDTIVVLWSDHGWHLGEKNHWRKFSLWERGDRSVLMIKAPGVTKPGSRCDVPVNLIDLYPTITQLCGLPDKPGLDGVSLVPLLKDASLASNRTSLTTFKFNNHSVRSARWRYTRYADGSEELYDHDADPNEWTNIAADPKLAGVKAELAKSIPTENAPMSAPKPKSAKPSNDE